MGVLGADPKRQVGVRRAALDDGVVAALAAGPADAPHVECAARLVAVELLDRLGSQEADDEVGVGDINRDCGHQVRVGSGSDGSQGTPDLLSTLLSAQIMSVARAQLLSVTFSQVLRADRCYASRYRSVESQIVRAW
jgi:hypothetical protein